MNLLISFCCCSAFLAAAGCISIASPIDDWNYDGLNGPLNWSNKEKQCNGKSQSPVDLLSNVVTSPDKQPKDFIHSIKFSWPELKNVVASRETNVVRFTPKCKDEAWIQVKGKTFNLDNFHYHSPSEHRNNNQHADLEFHFVFKGKENSSRILVVGFRFNVVKHHSHEFIKELVNGIPSSDESLTLEKINIDNLAKSSHRLKRLYTYTGSLTTPPCTEGVQWLIVENILDISVDNLKTLRQVIGFNSRPTSLGPNEASN